MNTKLTTLALALFMGLGITPQAYSMYDSDNEEYSGGDYANEQEDNSDNDEQKREPKVNDSELLQIVKEVFDNEDQQLQETKRILGNDPQSIDSQDAYDNTPLLIACDNNLSRIAKFLIEKGADSDAQNNHDGWTPLLCAIKHHDLPLIKQLVKAGANIYTENKNGDSPLLLACKSNNFEAVRLLLGKGAHLVLERENNQHETPLLCALQVASPEVIGLLLAHGAKLSSKQAQKYTKTINKIPQFYKTLRLFHAKAKGIFLKEIADTSDLNSILKHARSCRCHNIVSFLSKTANKIAALCDTPNGEVITYNGLYQGQYEPNTRLQRTTHMPKEIAEHIISYLAKKVE